MADGNITKDVMYEAVAPGRLRVDAEPGPLRPAFDRLRQDHQRHPRPLLGSARQEVHRLRRAVGHGRPRPLVPETMNIALQTDYVSSRLTDPALRAQFVNKSLLRSFSSILHGEQGALNLSASLCHVLYDQGAQEYAANQTREEARHVTAFAKYIKARWGRPVRAQRRPQGPRWSRSSPRRRSTRRSSACRCWSRAWPWAPSPPSSRSCNDPLGKKLMQLVMTDEAFHHKFGKIWADRTVPKLIAGRARHRRGLGGALLPGAAVQPRLADRAARPLRGVRPRPGQGAAKASRRWPPTSSAART